MDKREGKEFGEVLTCDQRSVQQKIRINEREDRTLQSNTSEKRGSVCDQDGNTEDTGENNWRRRENPYKTTEPNQRK